jgi:hypothetical protein
MKIDGELGPKLHRQHQRHTQKCWKFDRHSKFVSGCSCHDEVGHSNMVDRDSSDLKIRNFPVAGWLNGQALGHSPFKSD